jgi:uncharacterized protein YbjT (DUF2867 family)
MSDPVLVTGATGTQGGAVARALLKRGHQVRALTRNPDSEKGKELAGLGIEVVRGDFDDVPSLIRAATGTAAVFAMGTPFEVDVDTETRQGVALIDAAQQAGTRHVVYTSVASALDGTGVPHFESKAQVERHLASAGVPWTVIAPTAFLESIDWAIDELAKGRYSFPLAADVPLQQVVIDDLASFAALVLDDPSRFTGQRIELASVQTTGAEFAAALSRWVGHPVQYVATPLGPEASDDLRAMVKFFSAGGYTVNLADLHAKYPEVSWHTLETWSAEQDWSRLYH